MGKLIFLPLLLAGACNWTDFDDLSNKTWVHSTDKPNIGSTDYGVAIVGVTTQTQGGQLAIISNDTPNYSTLDYAADGSTTVGPNNQKLGIHFIASLSDPPILVTDGTGKVAIVERAIDAGNIAVVLGTANMVNDAPFASMATPDSATFAGNNLLIAAGANIYTVTGTTPATNCAISDTMFRAAALASDGTTLYVWTQAGAFYSVPVASPCAAPGNTFMTTGFMPANGAKIHILGNFAILAGHAMSSTSGRIFVVNTMTMIEASTSFTVEGLKSSTVGSFGGANYIAVGIPSRIVDAANAAGQVEVYRIEATGELISPPTLTLNDAQPEANQQFGRQVATMKFNNQQILVVGAKSEIFAYYKTALYDALPQ